MCAMMEKVILPTFQEMGDNTDYSKLKDCTIVIPTYNRPAYLRRILGYYDRIGIPLSVIVADSSSDRIKDLNRDICEACRNLEIQYSGSYNSNLHLLSKVVDAVQQVSTPFVVLCPDDDFIIPRGMLAAMDFLSAHPEYKVAQGRGMIFYSATVMGVVQFGVPGMGITIDDASAEQRLIRHEEKYNPTFTSVHDTEFLQQIFAFTRDDGVTPEYGPEGSGLCLLEMYPTWLTAIYSRIGIISPLYIVRDRTLVRQLDMEKGWSKDYCYWIDPDLSGKQSWVKSDTYAHIKKSLIKHIRKQTGMEEENAGVVVDQIIEWRRQKEQNGQNNCMKYDMKGRIIGFMGSVLPHNRWGDWIRRTQYNNNSLDYRLAQQLIDDHEYQDCCRIRESILEFQERC